MWISLVKLKNLLNEHTVRHLTTKCDLCLGFLLEFIRKSFMHITSEETHFGGSIILFESCLNQQGQISNPKSNLDGGFKRVETWVVI